MIRSITAGMSLTARKLWLIAPQTQPEPTPATTYFHVAARIGFTPRPIGLPAYQNAGTISSQKDEVQATAIPTAPHGNARRNNKPVTATSTRLQRSQRAGVPMER